MNLNPLTRANSGAVFDVWSDFETVKFTNWAHTPDRVAFAERMERALSYYAKDPLHFGPLVILADDNQFLGMVGADHHGPASAPDEYELWYILRRSEWGRGFASKAVSLLMAAMLDSGRVRRVVATAVSSNPASWRILERQGFRRERVETGGFVRHGLQLDLFHYVRQVP